MTQIRKALLKACLRPATKEFYIEDGEIKRAKRLGAIYACCFCEERLRPTDERPPKWWLGHDKTCIVYPGEALVRGEEPKP